MDGAPGGEPLQPWYFEEAWGTLGAEGTLGHIWSTARMRFRARWSSIMALVCVCSVLRACVSIARTGEREARGERG